MTMQSAYGVSIVGPSTARPSPMTCRTVPHVAASAIAGCPQKRSVWIKDALVFNPEQRCVIASMSGSLWHALKRTARAARLKYPAKGISHSVSPILRLELRCPLGNSPYIRLELCDRVTLQLQYGALIALVHLIQNHLHDLGLDILVNLLRVVAAEYQIAREDIRLHVRITHQRLLVL